MKNHLYFCLSATISLMLAILSGSLHAATAEYGNITVDTRDNYADFAYIDNGTSITITGYTFTAAKSVDIPATIMGKPVTAIAAGAFLGCGSLQTVTIPASITFIGNNAFSGSSSLTQAIFVGNAPTTVGAGAFASTSPTFKVLYNGTATGFSSPTWQGYPSQALVPSADVFANMALTCRDRQGIMDIVFDHLSPGVGDVRALYSLDGGTSWRPLRTATGALGTNVAADRGLKISWDYAADGILTDPAYGTQIAIKLISTTPPGISEDSTPAPNRIPAKPVQVNFCFGHPANISIIGKGSAMEWSDEPSAASNPYSPSEQEAIRLETELIYRRAGVTSQSMTFVIGPPQSPGASNRVINVYFTPQVGSITGVCTPIDGTGRIVDQLDRFGKSYREATVLIATAPSMLDWWEPVRKSFYHHPVNLAEHIAHELGHGLGMTHIEKQPSSQECITDYTYGFLTDTVGGGGPVRANFSHEPLRITSDPNGYGVNTQTERQNEMYYLLRWVEGIRIPYQIIPGEYDLENFALTVVVARSSSVSMNLAGAPLLYDVKVMRIGADGEVGTVVREFPTLSAQQLLDFKLETGGTIRIIASSIQGGEPDVAIVPEAQTDLIPFSPVQGQTMKVVKYDDLGLPTNIGTGTTQSVTTSPVMPKDISVKPTGFDGAHVRVEFACEPGYQYTLEHSDDCNTWTPVPALTNIPGSNEGRLSLLDENAGQEKKKLFYRVKVQMPAAP